MEATLTGRDAHEALGVYARLAAANARFDAASVSRLVVTATGRRRVLRGLAAALRNALRPAGRSTRRPKPRSSSPKPARSATSSPSSTERPRPRERADG